MIVQSGNDFSIPPHVTQEGYAYFLETNGVAELLEMINQKRSSRETKAEFVCYYASWDAYPAFYNNLETQPYRLNDRFGSLAACQTSALFI
jgi:hypothetical protein